jgi:hypothetical protein
MAVGAVIAGVGLLIGERRGRRRKARPAEPKPVCGCTHHRALHDVDDGICHGTVARQLWNDRNLLAGMEHVPCPCRRYVGPEPISSLWTPPLLTEEGNP